MEHVLSAAEVLVAAFHNCDVYKEHARLKLKLEDNPDLKSKINEFQKASVNYESKKLAGEMPPFEEERRISGLYAEITLHDDGRRYLAAKDTLYNLLNQVFTLIGEKCTLE